MSSCRRALRLGAGLVLMLGLIIGPGPVLSRSRALAQATPTAESTAATAVQPQYTPLSAAVFSTPRWFLGSDGRVHLVYEVMLTNAFPVAATVTQVEVLDGGTGRVLATLAGGDLLGMISLLASGGTPEATVPPSTIGMLWLDLPFANPTMLPTTVTHRITVAVPPGLPVSESITTVMAPATVDLRPPVVLGAPLAGDQWAAVGSCCDGPHRRALQPIDGGLYLSQRFAIDFNKLTADNRFNDADPTRNTSYPTYGQPVLAVANATVVAAVDQYEDQVPGQTVGITLENADGNYIILDLGDGRFAFYAHLRPGTVRVRAGDTVERGQPIAEAGNTGSSDGPHLHFHLMDAPSALVADGLPYVFADYTLTGQMPPIAETLTYFQDQAPVPINTAGAGPRPDSLPLGGSVVTFPALAAAGS